MIKFESKDIKFKERLGIFYTCNYNNLSLALHYDVLQRLKSIQKPNVEILTSVWQPIVGNPFEEHVFYYTRKTYLNLVLQILHILYTAKRKNNFYRYVSFLEHDVFYPEGYFDYPDFDNGVLINTNYIGLTKFGYITVCADVPFFKRWPLFQLTMLFDHAVAHFSRILEQALTENDGILEPYHELNYKRIDYNGKYPSLHFDTNDNFSPHFSIYNKTQNYTLDVNDYWGHVDNYKKYFFNW